jgi:TonB family protein
MKRKGVGALLFLALAFLAGSLQAGLRLDLKLRVYEGARQGPLEAPEFVTSSYLQPTISANMPTGLDLAKERQQIKRVFNLQDISLLTEADLVIGEGGQAPDNVRHFFRLNGNAYQLSLVLKNPKAPGQFIVVFSEMDADIPKPILTTEMILAGGHSAVFGFEDHKGKPYFCSLFITAPPDLTVPPPPPPPPPAKSKELINFEEGAVKVVGPIKPPKLLKTVSPVYPEKARKEKVEGIVVLSARTDIQGNVKGVIIIHSDSELLSAAAMEAVKQWKYEPFLLKGQPKEVVFTVTVGFALKY